MAIGIPEIAATAFSSVGAAGYIGIAANVAQLGDSTVRLAGYLKRKLHPSVRDEVDDLSYVVALIYSKFSRRALLYGLMSLLISGFVAADMPWDFAAEITTDFAVSVIPFGSMLLTVLRRRLHRKFGLLVPITQRELQLLLTYEKVVDRCIGQTINSKRYNVLMQKYGDREIEQLLAEPRFIGGGGIDIVKSSSGVENEDLIRVVTRLNPNQSEEFLRACQLLANDQNAIFSSIGDNNLAVVAWFEGKWANANNHIENASLKAEGFLAAQGEIREIIEHNRQIIKEDRDIMPKKGGGADNQ